MVDEDIPELAIIQRLDRLRSRVRDADLPPGLTWFDLDGMLYQLVGEMLHWELAELDGTSV